MALTLDTKSSEWCAQHDKSIMSSDYITLLSKQERKSMSLIKKRGHSEIFSFYCPDWVCSFSMFWRIVNKEVLQSISRPHTKAKIVCTAGNLSDKHKHIWSWTGCIQMVPHLKPRHRSPVFFLSYWVKWGQWSVKGPNWLHALRNRTDWFAGGFMWRKCPMCACVGEFVCTRVRERDSSVGWVGWGTLVICRSHTVLSPPCPRLVHTKHIALITRPVGLRPGDRELLRPTGVCILCWCQVTSRTIQWLTSKITLEKKNRSQWCGLIFLAEMVMSGSKAWNRTNVYSFYFH